MHERGRPGQTGAIFLHPFHILPYPHFLFPSMASTTSHQQQQAESVRQFTFSRLARVRVFGCCEVANVCKRKSEVGAARTHITSLARCQAQNICICSNVGLHILQVVTVKMVICGCMNMCKVLIHSQDTTTESSVSADMCVYFRRQLKVDAS